MAKFKPKSAPIETFEDISNYQGKRRVPRRPISCRIGLLVKGVYMLANAYEIGEGGIMIDSHQKLDLNQKIVVSIRVPQVLQGVMLSHVVYVLPPKTPGSPERYGVQFDQIEFDVKRMIRNYVASSLNLEALETRAR